MNQPLPTVGADQSLSLPLKTKPTSLLFQHLFANHLCRLLLISLQFPAKLNIKWQILTDPPTTPPSSTHSPPFANLFSNLTADVSSLTSRNTQKLSNGSRTNSTRYSTLLHCTAKELQMSLRSLHSVPPSLNQLQPPPTRPTKNHHVSPVTSFSSCKSVISTLKSPPIYILLYNLFIYLVLTLIYFQLGIVTLEMHLQRRIPYIQKAALTKTCNSW